MGNYSEEERNELMIYAVCGMSPQIIVLSERSQTGRERKGYNSSHAEFLEMYGNRNHVMAGMGCSHVKIGLKAGLGELGNDGYYYNLNYDCFIGADWAFDGGPCL